MTEAQWLFEYHALRKKEEDELKLQTEIMKAGTKVFRDVLVGVAGLDLFVPKDAAEGSFIPAAWIFGNHHLLTHFMDEKKKDEDASVAMKNDAFEAFSQKLARGDVGDLDPILLGKINGVDVERFSQQAAIREAMKTLGIKPRAENAAAAPHFGKKISRGVTLVSDAKDLEGVVVLDEPQAAGPGAIEIEPGVFVGGDDG